MSFGIDTGLSGFLQRQMRLTAKAIERSLKRIASGKRLSGAHDAISSSLAATLKAQERGLLQATRNISDAEKYLNTAEGALDSQSSIIQQLQSLALQASSGTLTESARASLNTQAQELLSEFNRITSDTSFNGTKLLNGSFSTTKIQVGNNKGETISFDLPDLSASKVFTTETTVATGTYSAGVSFLAGSNPNDLKAVDLNGDGNLDLISANSGNLNSSIFLGNGDGTFVHSGTLASPAASPYSALTGDVNEDGNVDIIIPGNQDDLNAAIFFGNGDGSFASASYIPTGKWLSGGVLKDINEDGHLDLIASNVNDSNLDISLGNGDGSFQTHTLISTGISPAAISSADINNDGHDDILTTDSADGAVSVFLGNGDGSFQSRVSFAIGATSPIAMALSDFNADGNMDLVIADNAGSTSSVFLGNGDGSFQSPNSLTTGVNARSVSVGDLNDDGIADLVIGDESGTASVFIGNGDGTFKARSTIAAGGVVTIGDFNGDGGFDIASANTANANIQVSLANTTQVVAPSSISLSTQEGAQDALLVLNNALSYVNAARARIQAVNGRLDSASDMNLNTIGSLASARSEIEDTDYASEISDYSHAQNLQYAQLLLMTNQADVQRTLISTLLKLK